MFKMPKQFITDCLIFGSILLALYFGETIGPNKVGFWCNDESIRHEFLPQTIDFRILLFIIFVIPVTAFVALDRSDLKYNIRNYYYGLLMNILLTMYCKLTIGRPRPNFMSLCKPDVQCAIDQKLFISNYTCTNDRKWLTSNSNQSFFSGHSSLGTYSAFFLIFYLNDKLRINGFLKAHLFFIIFMIGLFPGLTQYMNFWHFFSDVLIGDTVGILLALFVYYAIRNLDRSANCLIKNLKTKG